MSKKPTTSANPALTSELFPVVYGELRKVARRYLARERRNHTLQPTALVHEAWLRLRNERRVEWNGRTHVLAIGAQAMRRLLVDHGRSRKRVKRGGGDARVTLNDWLAAAEDQPVSVEEAVALDGALTRRGRCAAGGRRRTPVLWRAHRARGRRSPRRLDSDR